MDGFIGGFSYGLTSVIVGQPLDTIKTTAQMRGKSGGNFVQIGVHLFKTEGLLKGLYRGSISMIAGGALFRSAQFGVNGVALKYIHDHYSNGKLKAEDRLFGYIDWTVVIAGFCGGLGRGIVEAPFEYVKVRRQLGTAVEWNVRDVLGSGMAATVFRNSFLFSSFVVYMDIAKMIVPNISPFVLGSMCANLAWLSIWPLDVVKTAIQSGEYKDKSFNFLLKDTIRSGRMFTGLVPGLLRSTIANGLAMVVMKRVERELALRKGL
jgi:solute carrier family 25 (mitochondrial carnitine/acylcarnitine transporter), member 20/29